MQVSWSNQVVLSADQQGAAAFEVVPCLVSDSVPEALHPACVSLNLIDSKHKDLYVRHRNYFLQVDHRNGTNNLELFKLDSSFIVRENKYHPGIYTLESLNYRQHFISSQADGRLKIVPLIQITDRWDVSFRFNEIIPPRVISSRTYRR